MLLSGIQHILNLSPSVIAEKAKESAKKTPEHAGSGRAKDGNPAKQNLAKLYVVSYLNQLSLNI